MTERTTFLIYGDSGSGKTTLIESLAVWLWRREGKRTRLVTGDGGGWDSIQHLVTAGIVEPWDISRTSTPFETVNFATLGYWPKQPRNPASELIPGTFTSYEAYCRRCTKVVRPKGPQGVPANFTCSTCKATIGDRDTDIENRTYQECNPENGLDKIGLYAFEGLTAFANIMMAKMSDRAASGEKLGPDAAVRLLDGKTWVGGSGLAHYGMAQRRVLDAIEKSRGLPCYTCWTALQMRATDTDISLPVFGPEVVGKALTASVSRSFANSFNIAEVPTGGGKKERRLYITTWFDQQNPTIPHLCKKRIPAIAADGLPDFLPIPNPPPANESWGIGKFLELLEERQARAAKMYATTAAQK